MTACLVCEGSRRVLVARVWRGEAVWGDEIVECPLCFVHLVLGGES